MDDDLEARLESHAQAFEGLLSLIPAENYYAKDNSDQWQRKKQTKEEKRAARKAKLDPANQKSAMDVINENEKKRKRELGIESEGEASQDDQFVEETHPKKKVKQAERATASDVSADVAQLKAEKRKEKRERKKEKVEKKKAKAEVKKAKKDAEKIGDANQPPVDEAASEANDIAHHANDIDDLDVQGLADEPSSTAPTSPAPDSPPFDISANHSTASSSTSIIPAAEPPISISKATEGTDQLVPTESTTEPSSTKPIKQKALNLPKVDTEELQARLKSRIEALRLKRKADGPDGQPVRSRQDLLEARRKKSESRKQHKKELRAKAKAEEERINQERLQGSGSPLSNDIFSPRSPLPQENNFSFGRVAFEDGALADANLSGTKDIKKKKGPQDPKGALEVAKKKEDRLKSLDEGKRTDIEKKDLWLNAKKRAHGERVRDDTNLLKKALKRKEKQKSHSEKTWNEREEGIKKGQVMKQRKREENLAKRKEEKGGKGKKAFKGKPKKKGRPGFEGK